MSKTPDLPTNSVAKILPLLWLIFIFVFLIVTYFFITSLKKQALDFINSFDAKPTPTRTTIVFPSTTKKPVVTITKIPTAKPTKVVIPCTRLNIREGEFASNKCYTTTDYNNLINSLNQLDSANFDLQSAQSTINITCNCRVPQECEFFKNSCNEAKSKKATAETNINNYRSIIRSIISRGK